MIYWAYPLDPLSWSSPLTRQKGVNRLTETELHILNKLLQLVESEDGTELALCWALSSSSGVVFNTSIWLIFFDFVL